ncbi:MAG: S8 family serine peptidase [Flavobacteriales bacterium]|nr:S8 family serine peptidase [Flavobacteriales bacterium]MCW5900403.1 S8 family serine peptidase [Flavobacteriales bacterium]
MAVSTAGGVVVTGAAPSITNLQYATVRYAANGTLLWSTLHGSEQGDDKALALTMGSNGVFYASGQTATPGGGTAYTTIKYDVYTKDHDAVLDSLGNPLYLDREVIVKFRPHLLDTAFVDNKNMQHTTLDKLVPDSVAGAIAAKLGVAASRLRVVKTFLTWTRADSISVSRLGEELRLPKFWSVFGMETGGMEPVEACDSLRSLYHHLAYTHTNLLFQFYTNDPIYDEGWQSSLKPKAEYPDAHINIEPAWAIQAGQPFIKVGIVDTPINWDHEDFIYQGQTKILSGYDYHPPGVEILPTLGTYNASGWHGTACASIVGSLRNNGIGVAGIAGGDVNGTGNTGASIVPLVVGGGTNYLELDIAAAAVVNGSSQNSGSNNGFGCHVLNISWGADHPPPSQPYPILLAEAVLTANQNHCAIAASHGNYGVDQSVFRALPSAFAEHPDGPHGIIGDGVMLSVGATGDDGRQLLSESNNTNGVPINSNHHFGLDLVAPGSSNIVFTALGGSLPSALNCNDLPWETFGFPQKYACFQGTSSAAPHVAGVAALMLAEHSVINGAPNGLAPEDIEHILEQSAKDIFDLETEWPPYEDYQVGYDDYHGHGRLDAGAALELVTAPHCVVHSSAPLSTDSQQFSNEVITIPPNNLLGLPHGEYNAYRVMVTHEYFDGFPITAEIIVPGGSWGRESSTIGTHGSGSVVNGRTWANYVFVINGNSVDVTATTSTWFILNSTDNSIVVNEWFPAVPGELRTAYSLLVVDGDCWGPSTVSTDEVISGNGIVVYPNPASDMLTIDIGDLAAPGWELTIIDALGRKVISEAMGAQRLVRMPVGQLRAGAYCLLLRRHNEVHTRRFIKQN